MRPDEMASDFLVLGFHPMGAPAPGAPAPGAPASGAPAPGAPVPVTLLIKTCAMNHASVSGQIQYLVAQVGIEISNEQIKFQPFEPVLLQTMLAANGKVSEEGSSRSQVSKGSNAKKT